MEYKYAKESSESKIMSTFFLGIVAALCKIFEEISWASYGIKFLEEFPGIERFIKLRKMPS